MLVPKLVALFWGLCNLWEMAHLWGVDHRRQALEGYQRAHTPNSRHDSPTTTGRLCHTFLTVMVMDSIPLETAGELERPYVAPSGILSQYYIDNAHIYFPVYSVGIVCCD